MTARDQVYAADALRSAALQHAPISFVPKGQRVAMYDVSGDATGSWAGFRLTQDPDTAATATVEGIDAMLSFGVGNARLTRF